MKDLFISVNIVEEIDDNGWVYKVIEPRIVEDQLLQIEVMRKFDNGSRLNKKSLSL